MDKIHAWVLHFLGSNADDLFPHIVYLLFDPWAKDACSVIETIPGKFSIWFSYLHSELRVSEQYHAALEPGGFTLS